MEDNCKIELLHITKRFSSVVANDDISLRVKPGSIHAIVGENGAGKTTLMSILYGLLEPDSGEIRIDGKTVRFLSPRDAIRNGIGMVHQHFMLIPRFTVTQNVVLGMELGSFVHFDYPASVRKVEDLCAVYGMHIPADTLVSELSVPMQQRVEIIKTLYRKAEVLIFDEPTAVLTPQEITEFCEMTLQLKAQGKTILFISHKLPEIMSIADEISVIRRGKIVDTLPASRTNARELTALMVGRELSMDAYERTHTEQEDLLCIEGLRYSLPTGVQRLDDVSLRLHSGEILGIAGVDGNGQEELWGALCGQLRPNAGSIRLMGHELTCLSTHAIRALGVGMIFEDRQKHGLVMDMSIQENLILGHQEKKSYRGVLGMLRYTAIGKAAKALRDTFDIRCASLESKVRTLSGGNQQKIVLARELFGDPVLVLAAQPTRGLDVGAIDFVHRKLMEQRNADKGVLLFSLELDELLHLCDRIAVLYKGRVQIVLDNKNLTKEQIGRYMLGLDGKAEAHVG